MEEEHINNKTYRFESLHFRNLNTTPENEWKIVKTAWDRPDSSDCRRYSSDGRRLFSKDSFQKILKRRLRRDPGNDDGSVNQREFFLVNESSVNVREISGASSSARVDVHDKEKNSVESTIDLRDEEMISLVLASGPMVNTFFSLHMRSNL